MFPLLADPLVKALHIKSLEIFATLFRGLRVPIFSSFHPKIAIRRHFLTHSFPMHPFGSFYKNMVKRYSNFNRSESFRNGALGTNGLSWDNNIKQTCKYPIEKEFDRKFSKFNAVTVRSKAT